ncbi:16S rRNA (guanine(527)-N(7))-methyltransferase RsmG [Sphingomonas sp. ASV193]|uniref:16S rRNA (guanine(527)-N(7))-methyltransferase RsmG n=1 Tax=Sphingomonas sp. ASV193 TaxID=3144405 RepID=UPI0032E8D724
MIDGVSRETSEKLEAYVSMLLAESRQQNLISSSTEADVWDRHIRDSLQLLDLAKGRTWADVGSGAGLPGIPIAIASDAPIVLIEPRAKRVQFLTDVVDHLGLANASIHHGSASSASGAFDVITARAVAPLDRLLGLTWHLAHAGTTFVFPKGRNAQSELETATRSWQGDFRLRPSVTSDEAAVVVATNVRRRGKR